MFSALDKVSKRLAYLSGLLGTIACLCLFITIVFGIDLILLMFLFWYLTFIALVGLFAMGLKSSDSNSTND
jgi:hypothetical protein